MIFFNTQVLKKYIQQYKEGQSLEKFTKFLKKQKLSTLVRLLLSNHIEVFQEILLLYFEHYSSNKASASYKELQKIIFKFENDPETIESFLIFFYRYLGIDLVDFYANNGQESSIKKTLLHKFACYPGLLTLNVNHLSNSKAKKIMELFSEQFQLEGAKKTVLQDERFFILFDEFDPEYLPPESWEWQSQIKLSKEEAYSQNFKFISKNLLIKLKYAPYKIPDLIQQYNRYLESLHFKDILSDVWNRSGSNLNHLLSVTFRYWQDFNYQDWLDILKNIRNNGDALLEFFTFTYKYLRIDLMTDYAQLSDVNEEIRQWILGYIANNPGILAYFKDEGNLIHKKISDTDLQQIQKKLLSEGSVKAIPLKGEDFITDKEDYILSAPMNGKPLEGWKWAEKYV